ncbi:MAG TPA: aldose 1-epimerase [Steroidobacteraceae bacterium]|nr:aldose 1-epimerase [Steroidobacteraceae bacterium]
MISLAHEDLRLELLPDLGAAVSTFRYRGRNVLRPTPPGTTDPFETAAFALVPFANRIAGGIFRVGGREVRIERNGPGQTHPLHGHAWRRPWRIESVEHARVSLSFEHPPDSWPWRYWAAQTLTLTSEGLEVALAVENRDSTPMPAGLGWHPYFHKGTGARLEAQLQGVWLSDKECLPARLAPGTRFGDWSRGGDLNRPELIDHCHTGWSGRAVIRLPEERLRLGLAASLPLRWLHIYSPPDKDFFCVEPVSHMPDAVNRPEPPSVTGVKLLEPGERLEARVMLIVSEETIAAGSDAPSA